MRLPVHECQIQLIILHNVGFIETFQISGLKSTDFLGFQGLSILWTFQMQYLHE